MGQPHYAYFQNRECEFFPCHKLPENGFHNCLFCYCPLYALGDKCGGGFTYSETGIKDCSKCTLPHSEAGYAHVTGKFFELAELAEKNRGGSAPKNAETPAKVEPCKYCRTEKE
ncbi:MAG: cysteine-rich small domain-containing protein [Clostridia bacterium]|nr:cysteine-rich small domain-containing protein [Clostridia bacterium]